MIKIIKEGKIEPKITTCSTCGCEFEYEFEDVKNDNKTFFFDAKYVDCPYCGKRIIVNVSFGF